jgi:lipopolysaccharide export system protein LptA
MILPRSFLPCRRTLARGWLVIAAVASISGAAFAQTPATELKKTTVTADRLEARNTGVEGHYVFIGHVHITGTNLEILCDRLEIFSVSKDGMSKDVAMADSGNIRRVLATGNVSISQEGRKATCGTAEILPTDGKIILTDNPFITDENTKMTMKGTRMTVYRGERSAEIENPEVVGPALPNLGFPAQPAPATPTAPPAKPAP